MSASPSEFRAPQGDMLSTLKTSFAEHPVPAGMIVTGLLWMFAVGGGALPRISQNYNTEGRWPQTRAANREGEPWFRDAREGVSNLIERQPLLLGAIGLAIGAGVAATLPITSVETNLMGEASDAARQQARELARERGSAASQVLGNVATAIVHESATQGLNKDELLGQVSDLSDRAERVAGGAVDSLRGRLG